jgi:hypothetical protein
VDSCRKGGTRKFRFSTAEEEILIESQSVKKPFATHAIMSPFAGE